MKDALGRYRINVVSELTGIPAATLRAWERRYGIPTPARTASAYRLYNEGDVRELKRLRDLCASGMAIAEAARLVRADRDRPTSSPPAGPDVPGAFELAFERIIDAVHAFDPDAIEHEVARAMYLGNAQEVFERVFAPAMQRVGDLWHDERITVAQEHLTSGIIENASRVMARLAQPSEPRWRVLLACVEEEDHVIPLYGLAIQMAGWGIRSIDLGARTPAQAVADAAQRLNPDGVALSVSVFSDAARAAAVVDAYAAACAGVPWFVGGSGVPALAEHIRARHGVALIGSPSDHRGTIERALSKN